MKLGRGPNYLYWHQQGDGTADQKVRSQDQTQLFHKTYHARPLYLDQFSNE